MPDSRLQVVGQRVRNYTVSVNGQVVKTGEAIGTKRILLLGKNYTAGTVVLSVQHAIAPPVLRQFAAFAPCPEA